jgi:hypothetical protein
MTEQQEITVSLNPDAPKYNPKQREFFDAVMQAVHRSFTEQKLGAQIQSFPDDGDPDELSAMVQRREELLEVVKEDNRYFFYGGAVSGGKTIISLVILVILAKIYPGSRWHVIRKSKPDLERTASESMNFILRNSSNVKWVRTKSDHFLQFSNGSRIYMMSENFDRDKDLDRFKGLMTNGFLLEQLEELQEATFNKCIERAGRWHMKGVMPPPIILATFNPTYGWLKKKIHDRRKTGELSSPYYYLSALPSDNPWNTDEQWRSWENMDPESYARFIKGEWDTEISNQFFHCFSGRNIGSAAIDIDPRYDIWLSFDFNVDPMTCLVCQGDGVTFGRVLYEFRQPNSDTYSLCDQLKVLIHGREHLVKVTGDASGKNRMSGTRGHINQYQIIKEQLGLLDTQFMVPSVNPGIADSRTFVNSLLYRLPELLIHPDCEHLQNDLRFVQTDFDRNGNIIKKVSGTNPYLGVENNQLGHLSDCFRYWLHIMFYDWFRR